MLTMWPRWPQCLYGHLDLIVIWAAPWQNQQSECAPSEDSDQPGHPPSLIRVFAVCAQWVAKDPSFLQADNEDSDQTGRMPRLIWVFDGPTCHFVGFVTMRLIIMFQEFLHKLQHSGEWFYKIFCCILKIVLILSIILHSHVFSNSLISIFMCTYVISVN